MNKYIEEAEKFKPAEELTGEDKLQYVIAQLDAFKKELYRHQVDIEVAKAYIKTGKENYVPVGEKNAQTAVEAIRSIVIHIEVLGRLRDELKKN